MGKYYTYDLDNHDYFAPMFEDAFHDCKDVLWCNCETTICKFCNTDFDTFERLLHHLAYHNYDVSLFIKGKDENAQMNPEMGDHGMVPSIKKTKLKLKGKNKRKMLRADVNTLAEDMMRLIDIKKK